MLFVGGGGYEGEGRRTEGKKRTESTALRRFKRKNGVQGASLLAELKKKRGGGG